MADAAIAREDYSHPERIYKDLTYCVAGKIPNEVAKKRQGLIRAGGGDDPSGARDKELCWSCGWSVKNEWYSSYGSRIRIFYTRGNIGIWEIGSRWMIRDRPNDSSLGNDYITQEFLRNQPNLNIPLLKEMQKLSQPTDKIDLTLMSRAQGVGLDTIWTTLSPEQKSNYRNQLAFAMKQWRQFTSPVAKKVNGGLPDDCMIAHCLRVGAPTCKKMGRTTEEWFNNIEEELRFGLSRIHKTKDLLVIEEKFQQLKNNFPGSEPYVLTHGDLNLTNIIVKDEKIEAIIDWELSGYFPWWAERWMAQRAMNDDMDELFDPLWADVSPEMDAETFQEKVWMQLYPVTRAWRACDQYVEHPNRGTKWLRPGFCECQPYVGKFQWDRLGNQYEHILRDESVVKGFDFLRKHRPTT